MCHLTSLRSLYQVLMSYSDHGFQRFSERLIIRSSSFVSRWPLVLTIIHVRPRQLQMILRNLDSKKYFQFFPWNVRYTISTRMYNTWGDTSQRFDHHETEQICITSLRITELVHPHSTQRIITQQEYLVRYDTSGQTCTQLLYLKLYCVCAVLPSPCSTYICIKCMEHVCLIR